MHRTAENAAIVLPRRTSAASLSIPSRWIALGLLAAAQVAFAFACTANGVRSGDWAVPWLPSPDVLVFLSAGATLAHLFLLYAIWAGIGPGRFLRRFGLTALGCAAFVSVTLLRASWRGNQEPALLVLALALTMFALAALACKFALRRWRIGLPGEPPAPALPRSRRPQFYLKHLLLGTTAAACVFAYWRLQFPDGVPAELAAQWWRIAVRMLVAAPTMLLLILPAALVPWLVLTFERRRTIEFVGVAICWTALGCGLVALEGALGLPRYFGLSGSEILATQLGASLACLVSALAVRSCGYRLLPQA